MKEDKITEYDFLCLLIKSLGLHEENEDIMAVARNLKLIDDYDVLHSQDYIQRRDAARIIHNTLLNILHEEDMVDWSAAEELKDLYDCHTCVNNIAQVYAKGIMDTKFSGIFDVNGSVTKEESTIFFLRMMNGGLRKNPDKSKARIFKVINKEEALEKHSQDSHAKLVDVRFFEDYEKWHLTGSVSIPLSEISKNPYAVDEDRSNCIMLYCKKGYQSRLAAGLLINAGFKDVYVVNGAIND